jgi:hypothetical protein
MSPRKDRGSANAVNAAGAVWNGKRQRRRMLSGRLMNAVRGRRSQPLHFSEGKTGGSSDEQESLGPRWNHVSVGVVLPKSTTSQTHSRPSHWMPYSEYSDKEGEERQECKVSALSHGRSYVSMHQSLHRIIPRSLHSPRNPNPRRSPIF